MEHMNIFDEICGEMGIGKDPHAEAAKWCEEEFKRLWTFNAKINAYTKMCRVFFIPSKNRNGYGLKQRFWGREGHYDVHFTINGEDSRYLAPLDLTPGVAVVVDSDKHGFTNSDLIYAITKRLGIDPQRLNFTEMIREGVEIELCVSEETAEKAFKERETGYYAAETINDILSKDGWLGSHVMNGEIKAVNCFLIWACFGVKISTSKKEDEIRSAFDAAICPTLKALDVERARFIRARINSLFGSKGGHVRGKSVDHLMVMVRQMDDMLISIGVEPPRRNGEWKSVIPA